MYTMYNKFCKKKNIPNTFLNLNLFINNKLENKSGMIL